MLILYSRET